jgi:hypothetical protein
MMSPIRFAIAALLAACAVEQPASGRTGEGTNIPAHTLASTDTQPSLHDILASRVPVGRMVRLTGHCLTLRGVKAVERPAGAGDLWQLEADGAVIVVSGTRPHACTATADTTPVIITAIVAEDTLPAIGDLPAAPRRYLLLIGGMQK